jgi:hypothetical protein
MSTSEIPVGTASMENLRVHDKNLVDTRCASRHGAEDVPRYFGGILGTDAPRKRGIR